jgi:hypothetical protein
MASFGFSISDIAMVAKYAYRLYQSCEHAGDDFRNAAANGTHDPS